MGSRAADRVAPSRPTLRHERVERRLRERVAESRELDRLAAVAPPTRDSPPAEDAEAAHRKLQRLRAPDRLEERAAPDRVEQRAAHARKAHRVGLAAPQRNELASSANERLPARQRFLLVAEDRRGEHVEEAVLARLRRIGVMQPGGRLEDERLARGSPG